MRKFFRGENILQFPVEHKPIFNAEGKVQYLVNSNNKINTAFSYNQKGLLVQKIEYNQPQHLNPGNANSNNNAQTTHYHYDSLGSLISPNNSNTNNITIYYDACGKRCSPKP
jgi:hypothetical protein